MKFLFQMDDPKKINIQEDSTYLMIKESLSRGIKCFYCDPRWVYASLSKKNSIRARILSLSLNKDSTLNYTLNKSMDVGLETMHAVFVRQDPPFNLAYISNTYLLEKLKKPLLINNPSQIRNLPEKHIMMNFPNLTPSTLISSDIFSMIKFIKKHKDIVITPAYGNGGLGIEKVKSSQPNLKKFLERYLKEFSYSPVILQKFLKNFSKGDKRIILLNGKVMGAVLRVPQKNSIKANFHAGGSAKKTNLTQKEKIICKEIKSFLIDHNLFFVGIDVIDGYLTEINITSPTGLHEINRLNNVSIEKDVIDFVVKSLK